MNNRVEHIWLDLHSELNKFILSKVREDAIAQDILQDVFIKVYLNIHQLKDSAKLTSWIYQITRNTIADYLKQPHSVPSTIELADESQNEPVYQALSNCVNSKIDKLSDQDRKAVLLTYFEAYSQKELSDFLGISYSGTKNRIQRARAKLRKDILDCNNVESDRRGRITGWTN
ncbi:MAG: sigma-70 family RNA polymerase sigma factor [Cyclobacteriaceae bacterium]